MRFTSAPNSSGVSSCSTSTPRFRATPTNDDGDEEEEAANNADRRRGLRLYVSSSMGCRRPSALDDLIPGGDKDRNSSSKPESVEPTEDAIAEAEEARELPAAAKEAPKNEEDEDALPKMGS